MGVVFHARLVTIIDQVTRLAAGQVEDLMEDIYQAYEKYRAPYDVVLMEGATQDMIGSNCMEVNAEVWLHRMWPSDRM